jgi:hypothetical protein
VNDVAVAGQLSGARIDGEGPELDLHDASG